MSRTPGVYHLLLRLCEPAGIRVGRLGRFTFPAGYYVYTGSAMNGLEARIARHRRRRKKLRWHVDYLLRQARVMEAIAIPMTDRTEEMAGDKLLPYGAGRFECARNGVVLSLPGASVVVPRFGASDCRCAAHLVYFGDARPELTFEAG